MDVSRTSAYVAAAALLSGLFGYVMHDHDETIRSAVDARVDELTVYEAPERFVIYDREVPDAFITAENPVDLTEAR